MFFDVLLGIFHFFEKFLMFVDQLRDNSLSFPSQLMEHQYSQAWSTKNVLVVWDGTPSLSRYIGCSLCMIRAKNVGKNMWKNVLAIFLSQLSRIVQKRI
jgi:hypothetical protein